MSQGETAYSEEFRRLFGLSGLGDKSGYVRLVTEFEPGAAKLFYAMIGSVAVPALLQTRAYAEQFVAAPFLLSEYDADTTAAGARLRIRELRQQRARERNISQTWFVEAGILGALAMAADEQGVMREQLDHLRVMAERGDLVLRVLPPSLSGESSGLFGRWVDIGTDGDGQPLYFASDTVDQTIVRDGHADLGRAGTLLGMLDEAALPPDESLAFFQAMTAHPLS